ncbi:helix-turn-helix domain-containing protein [Tepidamorphus sp. 3E244]|uniref:helix-turn-helix domain-containing protein n=1 Tax=Tepidamorphus sp. 3E244 TaxID=3385498 RepID=UPI0038FC6C55
MDIKKALGHRIRTLRKARSNSQEELAARINRSVDAISLIERGENWPSVETLERIAAALDMPTSELFNDLSDIGREADADDTLASAVGKLSQLRADDLKIALATIEALAANRLHK